MSQRKQVTSSEAYAAAVFRGLQIAEELEQVLVNIHDKIDPEEVDWSHVGTMARMVRELETIAKDLRDYVDG